MPITARTCLTRKCILAPLDQLKDSLVNPLFKWRTVGDGTLKSVGSRRWNELALSFRYGSRTRVDTNPGTSLFAPFVLILRPLISPVSLLSCLFYKVLRWCKLSVILCLPKTCGLLCSSSFLSSSVTTRPVFLTRRRADGETFTYVISIYYIISDILCIELLAYLIKKVLVKNYNLI